MPSKASKQLRCHYRGCGNFPHRKAAGLFCSKAHEKAEAEAQTADAAALAKAGFDAHPRIKRAFVRNGVTVSLDLVKHIGIEKALQLNAENAPKS